MSGQNKLRFINPYVSFYFESESLKFRNPIPFEKEVAWTFLKNLDSRLKLFKHRLNIVFVDSVPYSETRQFGSIYEFRKFLEQPFEEQEESANRIRLLEIIYEAFMNLGKENSWDLDAVDDSYAKSKGQIERFEHSTESKKSQDRKYSGRLLFSLKGNLLTFKAEVTKLVSNERIEYVLLETDEDNLSWSRMFNHFGWMDNSRFGFKFLGGDLWVVFNIETLEIEEVKKPKKFNPVELENYLLQLKKPVYDA